MTPGRDYGVLSGQTWRLADLGAKRSTLLAGLGWGTCPPLVDDDIARGRLKIIRPIASMPVPPHWSWAAPIEPISSQVPRDSG